MQGVGSDNTGVIVVWATNCLWSLDSAIRQCFEKRIYILLPDGAARKAFQLSLAQTTHALVEDDCNVLADLTDGYSCTDIWCVVKEDVPIANAATGNPFQRNYWSFPIHVDAMQKGN